MPRYFQFHVALQGIAPPIWRRFLLPMGGTFADLHEAIQVACGWEDCHLHIFRRRREWRPLSAIAALRTQDSGDDVPDSSEVLLKTYFGRPGNERCFYVYDYGDEWVHEVRLEEIVNEEASLKRRLLGGARAFPREDSGGIGGYEECLEALATPKPRSEEVEERLEWLGDWDPERPETPGGESVSRRYARSWTVASVEPGLTRLTGKLGARPLPPASVLALHRDPLQPPCEPSVLAARAYGRSRRHLHRRHALLLDLERSRDEALRHYSHGEASTPHFRQQAL